MSISSVIKERVLAFKLRKQIRALSLEGDITWQWAANHALAGAISGGTGWAVGIALNEIFGPSTPSIESLLTQFAEQIKAMLRESQVRERVIAVNVDITTLFRDLSGSSSGISSTELILSERDASDILSRTSRDDEIRLRVMGSYAIVVPVYVGVLFELAGKGPADNSVTHDEFANRKIEQMWQILRQVEDTFPLWTEDLIQPASDRVSINRSGFLFIYLDRQIVNSNLLGDGGHWVRTGGGYIYAYENLEYAEAAAEVLRRVVHADMTREFLAPIKHIKQVLSRAVYRFVFRRWIINSISRWK